MDELTTNSDVDFIDVDKYHEMNNVEATPNFSFGIDWDKLRI